MRRRLYFSTVLIVLCAAGAVRAQPQPVDLELAFVVDASGSIDEDETRLQRQGYADALVNPRVLQAIGSGFLRAIAVAYIEFAGPSCERVSVAWTRIDGADSARSFGARILALPRMFCPGGNAISDALALAAASIRTNDFDGTRKVIDVSGDGPNTLGLPVEFARDAAVAAGMTVNGLVIERPSMPDLDAYYRSAVTGGPRSFVITAKDRKSFAEAILKKMILEIAGRRTSARHAAAPARGHDTGKPR
ncbi:MAG: DUF1194 domain-containing protein [Defluviicoccus sp.]|nr:DUF1194 domain-containing protein [Defluviicoccus sp.]